MSSSIEHQLVCKIIETGDMLTPQKFKFKPESTFASVECRSAYTWLLQCFRNPATYGQVPSWQIFSHYYPGFPWCGSNDNIVILCEYLRSQRLRDRLLQVSADLKAKADSDPREGLATLREAAVLLGGEFTASQDMLMSDAYRGIVDEYESTTDLITGIPFPWDYLSTETQGKQPCDYTFIFARPGNLKSWMGVCVCAAYSYEVAKRRVLVWSMEMPAAALRKRIASVLCRVDYGKFKKRQLDPVVYANAKHILQNLAAMEKQAGPAGNRFSPALLITKPEDDATVTVLQAKIEEFKPDEVYIDGIYLMTDERGGKEHAAHKNISRDLKKLANRTGIPITAVSQQNRTQDKKQRGKAADTEDMAFTDAYAQDADLIFHLRANKAHKEVIWQCTKARDSELNPIVLNAHLSTDVSFKRFHTEDEEEDPGNQGGGGRQQAAQAAYQPLPTWRQP